MKIPNSPRKKALMIVDVQEWFMVERNKHILENIKKLIESKIYECIIYSISYNLEGSIWYTQVGWCENPKETDTLDEIKAVFPEKNVYKVMKLTRSIFKADQDVDVILQKHQIEEVHICGVTTYDCVYASAQESSDLWYFTFVIEEAVESRTTPATHTDAIANLRYMCLTNNSEFVWHKTTKFLEI